MKKPGNFYHENSKMVVELIKREIFPNSKEFKTFWGEKGPYKYALTSKEFPPVLLEPEEWIFSDDIEALLKTLMQFDKRKMKIVKSPFNPANKSILRPEKLSPWKINNFPEEWNASVCDIFVPEGHLTGVVLDKIAKDENNIEIKQVEAAFFQCLETRIEQLGYLLFKPRGSSKYAAVKKYLAAWEEDEQDAGLL
ncbi:hypothetical protein [Desulfobacula sp.]|uniref:hypothetical protein n=1 Tax=Desulfobacula sp. TaxID=2593537 RepID=UPI00262DFBA5|nr:hypothetical protein [Desulfobacula sp.]